MVAANDPFSRVHRKALGWKQPEPYPLLPGIRVLSFQCPGQRNTCHIVLPVPIINFTDGYQVFFQIHLQAFREDGFPILVSRSSPARNRSSPSSDSSPSAREIGQPAEKAVLGVQTLLHGKGLVVFLPFHFYSACHTDFLEAQGAIPRYQQ